MNLRIYRLRKEENLGNDSVRERFDVETLWVDVTVTQALVDLVQVEIAACFRGMFRKKKPYRVKTLLTKIHDPEVSKAQGVTAENYMETVVSPALAAWNMQLSMVNAPIPARVVLTIYHLVGRMIYLDSDVTAFLHLDLRIGFQDYGF